MAKRGRRRSRWGDGAIEERDGKYLARISRTEGGVRRRESKTFALRVDAEWWLGQAKRNGEAPEDVRLAEYLERWLVGKRRVAPSTRLQYENHIRHHIIPVLGGHKLVALRRRHIEAFIDDRLAHTYRRTPEGPLRRLSPATVGKLLVTLRSALSEAVPRDIPENPAARVEAPKVTRRQVRVVGASEAGRILDAVQGTWVEPIARFLFGSSLRISEALSINQGDIDWAAGTVRINASKANLRRLPVTDDAMDALRMAKTQAPRLGAKEPIFFSPRPNRQHVRDRLSRHSVSHALPKLLAGASIEALSAHGLRHTYATVALEAGIPIEAIAEQMGHKNPTMTRNRYAHVTPNLQRAALQIVNEAVKR